MKKSLKNMSIKQKIYFLSISILLLLAIIIVTAFGILEINVNQKIKEVANMIGNTTFISEDYYEDYYYERYDKIVMELSADEDGNVSVVQKKYHDFRTKPAESYKISARVRFIKSENVFDNKLDYLFYISEVNGDDELTIDIKNGEINRIYKTYFNSDILKMEEYNYYPQTDKNQA